MMRPVRAGFKDAPDVVHDLKRRIFTARVNATFSPEAR
jgi:hypothetical protein